MLVLTRKIGQRIVIGADVIVELVGIDSRQVRIGIAAPACVPIRREELPDLDRLQSFREADHAETNTPDDRDQEIELLRRENYQLAQTNATLREAVKYWESVYETARSLRALMRDRMQARIDELVRERDEALAIPWAVEEWAQGRYSDNDLRATLAANRPQEVAT